MALSPSAPAKAPAEVPAERVSLVDLLDRLLAGGVVVTGEITLSVADVDLITVSLRALLASVSALAGPAPRSLSVGADQPGFPVGADQPAGGSDDSEHSVPSRR
jgi:hypothetical protein